MKIIKFFSITCFIGIMIVLIVVVGTIQRNQTLHQLDNLTKIVAPELWSLNENTLTDYIGLIGKSEHLKSIEVFDEENNLISSFVGPPQFFFGVAVTTLTPFIREQIQHQPVYFNNQVIGRIRIIRYDYSFLINVFIIIITSFFALIFFLILSLYGRIKDEQERILVGYEQSKTALLILRKNKIIDCNQAALSLLKVSSKIELKKYRLIDFLHIAAEDKERAYKSFQDNIEKALKYNSCDFRLTLRNLQGDIIPVKISLSSFVYKQKKVLYTSLVDISKEIEYEQEKESMQRQVMLSSKLAAIGELAAGIGHEINNPLTIAMLSIKLIQKELQKISLNNPIINKALNQQLEANKRIAAIVDSLRTYSRVEQNTLYPIDVNELIRNTNALVENIYLQQDIIVRLDLQANPAVVKGNAGKFQQVLMNMITNAKDALEGCEPKLISISSWNENEDVVIQISDTGCGIEDAIIDKIFETFFTTKPVGRGTGLGLGISYAIIKEMHGAISVKSEVGKGTTFSIRLKQADTP